MKYDVLIDESRDKKSELRSAIAYVCEKKSVEPDSLNCLIKVTDEFDIEFKFMHFRPEGGNPNGTAIPFIFQSENYKKSVETDHNRSGKTVILINHNKLARLSAVNFASVVVHELSHCYDYALKLSGFQYKYNIEMTNASSGTVADVIGGYYTFHSEARAKFWQEMYVVDHHSKDGYKDLFFRRNGAYSIEPIRNESDHYYAAHCAGKLRCWEEAFIKNPIDSYCDEEKRIVEKTLELYLCKHKYHEIIKDMYEAWDWNLMIEKCDEVLRQYDGNLDAMVMEI